MHINLDTSLAKFKVLKFITFAVQLLSNHKIREIVNYYFDSGFQIQKGTELLFNALFFTGNTAMQIRLCQSWEGRGGEGSGGEWGCSVSSCSRRLKKCGNCRQKFYFRFVRKTHAIAPAALKDLHICFIN